MRQIYRIFTKTVNERLKNLPDRMLLVMLASLLFLVAAYSSCSSSPQKATQAPTPNQSADSIADETVTSSVPPHLKPDSIRLSLTSEHQNRPPIITSPRKVEAAAEIPFTYKATFSDGDGPGILIQFAAYPSWLTADHDSLFGVPDAGTRDGGFLLIVSDSLDADTQHVSIQMMPPIVVYGDTRTGHNEHRRLVNLIMNLKPLSVFHVGDLVNDGNIQSDWDTLNAIIGPLRAITEYFPALGNHEHQSPLFFANFELPHNEQWYSINRNHIHWIILNTCVAIAPGSEQYRWLENDLANVPDSIKFIIPVFHHPPYSTGPHTEDEMGLRTILVPLFQQYDKIGIVFTGHDHDYEKSFCGGIYYIVTGGGGAPLRDQARTHPCSQLFLKTYEFCMVQIVDNMMYVKVIDKNNNIIDRIELQVR